MPRPRGFGSSLGFGIGQWGPVQVVSAIDVFLQTQLPILITKQNAYLAANGKYWQGLITHSTPVTHTLNLLGDKTADRLNTAPTDQAERWLDFIPEWSGIILPCRFIVHTYNGPPGKGWSLRIETNYGPERWRRVRHFGVVPFTEAIWGIDEPE